MKVSHEFCLQHELFVEAFLPTASRENANLVPVPGRVFVRLPNHVLFRISEGVAGFVWRDELHDVSSDEDEGGELQSYGAEVAVERTRGFGRRVPLILKHIKNRFDGPFVKQE